MPVLIDTVTTPKNFVRVVGSTNPASSTNASFVVVPEMTTSLSISTGRAQLVFSGTFDVRDGDSFDLALFVDGAEQSGSRRRVEYQSAQLISIVPGRIPADTLSLTWGATGLSAGSHTFSVRWARVGGTARCVGVMRSLEVNEE